MILDCLSKTFCVQTELTLTAAFEQSCILADINSGYCAVMRYAATILSNWNVINLKFYNGITYLKYVH